MGCSQSRIENEEAVSRCKERKQFMKSSMAARNAFAASHSSFIMSLKNTGAALSDFAVGESINPFSLSSSSASAVIVEREKGIIAGGVGGAPLPPPPPPIPDMPAAPLQRAVSMPEFAVSKNKKPVSNSEPEPIVEEVEDEGEDEDEGRLMRRRHMKGNSAGGRMEMEENRGPPPQAHHPTYDYFFNVEDIPNGSLEDVERKVFDETPRRETGAKERVMEERKVAEKPHLPPTPMKKGKKVSGPVGNSDGKLGG